MLPLLRIRSFDHLFILSDELEGIFELQILFAHIFRQVHLLIRVLKLLYIKIVFSPLDLLLMLSRDLFAALGHHTLPKDSHVVRLINVFGLENVCERRRIEISV